jgi:F-type H+-transporting ATPase subunit a
MADPVLHIKDSYYFEVPKLLYPYDHRKRQDFPDVWISLDPDFQKWEADRLYEALAERDAPLPPRAETIEHWQHWAHADHAHFAKPLKVFLEEKYQAHVARFNDWAAAQRKAAAQAKAPAAESEALNDPTFNDYVNHLEQAGSADREYLDFLRWMDKPANRDSFARAKSEARDIKSWKEDESVTPWNEAKLSDGRIKLKAYNEQLSGKILIPQPFATLRNLYEKDGQWYEGLAISKYLLIEVVVGLVLVLIFAQLAQRIKDGRPPKGKLWNLLEVFLLFIRDQIVRPTIGGHHEEEHKHPEHGHEYGDPYAEHGRATDEHGHLKAEPKAHAAAAHGHGHHADPSSRFLPLLWTVFFFVLGCNLMGMVPWAGAPTAAFAVTFAMACVTLFTVLVAGMAQFGVVGFFMNQIPGMDLPWYMAILIKPMILVIELVGLLIKHGVLAVRLLANMVAGHLVILGIMGLAFGAEAALKFSSAPGWQWGMTAAIAVVAAAAFNVLELFVAFLQAYIITFLSALFIGAAIHKH